MASGNSNCGRRPMQFRIPPSKPISQQQQDGQQLQFLATGRCKMSGKTRATCRTTPMCKCRGRCVRPRLQQKTQQVCTAAHLRCRRIGSRAARLFISVPPKVCMRCSSMVLSLGTGLIVVYQVNMTSPTICKQARTRSQFLCLVTAHSHMLKIKTNGGWLGCIVKSF